MVWFGTIWLATVARLLPPLAAQQSFFVVCALAAIIAVPLSFVWLPVEATVSPARFTRTRSVQRLVASSGRYVKQIPYVPSRALGSIATLDFRRMFARFSPALRRYLLIIFVFYIGFAVFFGPLSAFLIAERLTSSVIFGLFIVSSLASAVIFVPVGRWSSVRGPTWLQTRALGVRVLLFPAIGMLGLVAALTLRVIGFGIGFALIGFTWAVVAVTAVALASRFAPDRLRGEALGMYTAIAGLGGGLGGVLGGALARVFGYQIAFLTAGGLVLISLVLLRSWAQSANLGTVTAAPDG